MAASRSLLFQLPRFIVPSRLGALYYHLASPSTSPGVQQRILAVGASQKQVAAHGEGGAAIVATSLRPWEAAVAAELLAGKRRAGSVSKPGRKKPDQNQSGIDKHHDVPDKTAKEGKQGTRNNYAASS